MAKRKLLLLTLLMACGVVRGEQADEPCDVSGFASGTWRGPVGGPSAAVSGAGLTAGRHGASIATNWMQPGAGGDNGAWFVFDLEGRGDLKKLVLWNYFEFGGNPQQNATLPNRGIATAMTNLTPQIGLHSHFGWPNPAAGFYANPYPLSEDLFLVSYCPGPKHSSPRGYGIYYFGRRGGRQLVYRDGTYSCFRPMPLRPRPTPPEIAPVPAGRDPQPTGTLFLADVYQGMAGIQRGRVKYLRVMEDVPKPWHASWVSPARGDSCGLQHPAVSLLGHFAVKRIHGIVPVHEDGSALFTVPAGPASSTRRHRPPHRPLPDRRATNTRQTLRLVPRPEGAKRKTRFVGRADHIVQPVV